MKKILILLALSFSIFSSYDLENMSGDDVSTDLRSEESSSGSSIGSVESVDRFGRINNDIVLASFRGWKDIVEQLIKDPKNINKVDEYNNTALMAAASHGYKDIVELLIKAKADLNKKNKDGNTALLIAYFSKRKKYKKDIIELLIKAGANLNATSNGGRTTLIWAAMDGNKDIVKLLIDAGADLNIKDDSDYTAIDWASDQGHDDVVQLLRDANAEESNTEHSKENLSVIYEEDKESVEEEKTPEKTEDHASYDSEKEIPLGTSSSSISTVIDSIIPKKTQEQNELIDNIENLKNIVKNEKYRFVLEKDRYNYFFKEFIKILSQVKFTNIVSKYTLARKVMGDFLSKNFNLIEEVYFTKTYLPDLAKVIIDDLQSSKSNMMIKMLNSEDYNIFVESFFQIVRIFVGFPDFSRQDITDIIHYYDKYYFPLKKYPVFKKDK